MSGLSSGNTVEAPDLSGYVTSEQLDTAIEAIPAGGDGYTVLYELHTGATATNLLNDADLTFNVTGYKQFVIEATFQPYNDNWAAGTDQWVLKMNGSGSGHNSSITTNYASDATYTDTAYIRLGRAASSSVMTYHVVVSIAGLFNSMYSDCNMGVVSGSVRTSRTVGEWLAATPAALTQIRLTTPFGDQIGVGSNSSIVIKAK